MNANRGTNDGLLIACRSSLSSPEFHSEHVGFFRG